MLRVAPSWSPSPPPPRGRLLQATLRGFFGRNSWACSNSLCAWSSGGALGIRFSFFGAEPLFYVFLWCRRRRPRDTSLKERQWRDLNLLARSLRHVSPAAFDVLLLRSLDLRNVQARTVCGRIDSIRFVSVCFWHLCKRRSLCFFSLLWNLFGTFGYRCVCFSLRSGCGHAGDPFFCSLWPGFARFLFVIWFSFHVCFGCAGCSRARSGQCIVGVGEAPRAVFVCTWKYCRSELASLFFVCFHSSFGSTASVRVRVFSSCACSAWKMAVQSPIQKKMEQSANFVRLSWDSQLFLGPEAG